jgi:signal transduction histidine kinase
MWVGIREMGRLVAPRWPGVAASGGVAGVLWLLGFRLKVGAGRRRHERRTEEELAAYAQLEMRLPADGERFELATRVSRVVTEKSAFRRAAMLVRDAEGRLIVAASAGMDDLTVQSLSAWGDGIRAMERDGDGGVRRGDGGLGVRLGGKSFAVVLGGGPGETGCRRAIVIPLWTEGGRMLGVLAVGADGLMSARRSALGKALEPLEALTFKLERAMENAVMAERLRRAEKLAGLGLLAGGMAHALSNPLTAVLGFAELIVDTTGEERVKEDARIIVREALRMRQTMETLLEFWQPAARSAEPVDVTALVRELAEGCSEKLESRGVRLVVQTGDEVMAVRGNRDRLRQMIEHLLNNAAEALAGVGAVMAGEERVIRVSLGVSGGVSGSVTASVEGAMVHLIVSDTGPGFREPCRVFEPCDATGLGLSVCYGIVHEHGGEISAFNLDPHGAAVAVALPGVDSARKKTETEWGRGLVA